MKSKTSATVMTPMTMARLVVTPSASPSRQVPQLCLRTMPSSTSATDSAGVGGRLEQVEDLLPLDDPDGVALLAEEVGNGLAVDEVGLVLEGVDLADVLLHAGALLQRLDGDPQLVGLLGDDRRQLGGAAPHGGDLGRAGRASAAASMASMTSSSVRARAWMSSRSSGVTKVVLRRWMICVRALVAVVLDDADLLRLGVVGGGAAEHAAQQPRAVLHAPGHGGELVEEAGLLGEGSETARGALLVDGAAVRTGGRNLAVMRCDGQATEPRRADWRRFDGAVTTA